MKLSEIAYRLANHSPETLSPDNRGHASVALILREGNPSPEILFIIRAEHKQDPWSGNIAFPGGRLNSHKETARQAAERETMEELSLDLGQAQYFGRLDDLYGATLPVLVSCFVYQLLKPKKLQPNHEVSDTFWCPLSKLLEPGRQQHRTFSYRGESRSHPVIELLPAPSPLLWGITYRLLYSLFKLCDHEFGLPGSCDDESSSDGLPGRQSTLHYR